MLGKRNDTLIKYNTDSGNFFSPLFFPIKVANGSQGFGFVSSLVLYPRRMGM